MAVFLDYARNSDGIFLITIREQNGVTRDFPESMFDDTIELLAQGGYIVVYERPVVHVERLLADYELLKDRPLRPRWLDVFKEIRKATGMEPSLTRVAEATLGPGPQSAISELPKAWSDDPSYDLSNKMHDRLAVLQQVYDYGERTGQVSFRYKDEIFTEEVQWIEPTLAD